MNAYLIATQGVGGGALSIATQGLSTVADVVVAPYVPQIGGGGGFNRYYSESRQDYEIPLQGIDEDEEEFVITTILLEIAKNELN